jgi:hypothetical protein
MNMQLTVSLDEINHGPPEDDTNALKRVVGSSLTTLALNVKHLDHLCLKSQCSNL